MDDTELDNILDKALEDFESEEQTNQEKQKGKSVRKDDSKEDVQHTEELNIEKIFESMPEDEKKVMKQFAAEMAKLFENEKKSDSKSQNTLKNTIDQTMAMMNENSKNLGEEKNLDENVLFERLMSTLASSGDDDKLYEFLEKIMESLMSKEVLEGPMRELKEKYPIWLEKNKDKLQKEEYDRIYKQYQYSCDIVKVYETEPDNIQKLIELMKGMQALGQPPQEIVDQLSVENTGKMPNLPDNLENCNLQ